MRSGACTVQQTLTTEAASVLKHSLNLARRRGHAQVTPLHVAATLLSLRTSVLKRACLKSQPLQQQSNFSNHPIHCRALELCFNVALNRLPTTPAPLFHGHPSLSNALIAALKRAQAHQRRGCLEQQQQQPLLTIKVELDQLIISILDDPSVSRVMREAGFSSTAVKSNIEDSSVFQCYGTSGGVFSSPCSPSRLDTQREVISSSAVWPSHFLPFTSDYPHQVFFSPQIFPVSLNDSSVEEDIKLVLEVFLRKKKRNVVVIGDSTSVTEQLVGELLRKLERGDVPKEMNQVQLIKFQLAPVALKFMKKEDVEMNIRDLRRKLESTKEKGVIIFTGDMKWVAEETGGACSEHCNSPSDHLITELGKLLSDYRSSNSRVWLLATSTYQTYMRCQMRQPPLEIHWGLQAVSIPSGGLGLSLQAPSEQEAREGFSEVKELKQFLVVGPTEDADLVICCTECKAKYEEEVQLTKYYKEHIPLWLQQEGVIGNQKDELIELKRKWSKLCLSFGHGVKNPLGGQENLHSYSSFSNQFGKTHVPYGSYQFWPTQTSIFPDSKSISFANHGSKNTGVPTFRRQGSDFNYSNEGLKHQPMEPSLDALKDMEGKDVKISLSLGSSFVSDPGKKEKGTGDFCKLLEDNLPWQSHVVPAIAEALAKSKNDTWMLIHGNDVGSKRRLALAIAEYLCGSSDSLFRLNFNEVGDSWSSCKEKLVKTLAIEARVVVLLEEVDQADTTFLKYLVDRFEGENGGNCQAIFILTKSDNLSYEDERRNEPSVIQMMICLTAEGRGSSNGSAVINHKRRADWVISCNSKAKKLSQIEEVSHNLAIQHGGIKKLSCINTLDLNVKADNDEDSEETIEERSPMSSDLTRDICSDLQSPLGYLEAIQNRFTFNKSQVQERDIARSLSQKMQRAIEDVLGKHTLVTFNIEERVIQEVVNGLGSFLNSLFDKWVREVFQTSLQTVKLRGEVGIQVKLCFGGKSDSVMEDGFKGTYLPNGIGVTVMD